LLQFFLKLLILSAYSALSWRNQRKLGGYICTSRKSWSVGVCWDAIFCIFILLLFSRNCSVSDAQTTVRKVRCGKPLMGVTIYCRVRYYHRELLSTYRNRTSILSRSTYFKPVSFVFKYLSRISFLPFFFTFEISFFFFLLFFILCFFYQVSFLLLYFTFSLLYGCM
jgi:hypothetical protein